MGGEGTMAAPVTPRVAVDIIIELEDHRRWRATGEPAPLHRRMQRGKSSH